MIIDNEKNDKMSDDQDKLDENYNEEEEEFYHDTKTEKKRKNLKEVDMEYQETERQQLVIELPEKVHAPLLM